MSDALTKEERAATERWRPSERNQICECAGDAVCVYHELTGLIDRLVANLEIATSVLDESHRRGTESGGVRTRPISTSFPLLAVARRHGVPYAATLALADAWLELARRSPEWRDGDVLPGLYDAVNPVCARHGLSSAVLRDVREHCAEPLLRREKEAAS